MQPNDLNLLFSRAIFFKACESFLPAIHAFSEIIDLLLHSDQEVEGRDTYSEENLLSGEIRLPAYYLYRLNSYRLSTCCGSIGLSAAHNHRGFCHRQLNQMDEVATCD